MKKEGKPVNETLQALQKAMEESKARPANGKPVVDFSNTENAFVDKTDEELKKALWLFKMMNKRWLVEIGSKVGLAAIRMRLPFVDSIVKKTIFEQFCGGTTLLESQNTIERLYRHHVLTILDYGAEGKETEEDYNLTMNETIRALEFAATHESVPMVSSKITGLAPNALLEKIQQSEPLSDEDEYEFENLKKRIDSICHTASKRGMSISFDAEESWIQDTIDFLVNMMMERYNTERAVVYNTYQLYRHDRLKYLIDSYNEARNKGYVLGAKLVRGAYMDKERDRAARMGYPSPIQTNKAATDDAYNTAIRFCVDHYEHIASVNATHNAESCLLEARLIEERKLPKDHPHLNFSQLYGMSDQITFNLAEAGYNVAKYVPYGAVKEVVPYLIRRAQENSSVTGDMSRELDLISREVKRRGLS
ncbi:MAG: proline dehydrogenase family protein [Saprospiraceae bacterium]|nr:proline dehydrogenase family protein [Saprospiraceae bacterium]MCB0623239.1 proline dehydrogenase family protein [Saprospiraceae bacterium]MCB0676871.1 proline dehydrogenase family protein [Saprospiraceae bacterium]MCB0681220.1 proline dehydrogenase family protein [Saprospiraceae bacterium]